MCQPTFPALFPKISAHVLQLCRSPSEWLAIFHIAVAYQKMHMCMCCICMHCKQYFISFWPEELPRKILCYFIKLKLNALKQLLYYVVVRSYSTLQYAELNGQSHRFAHLYFLPVKHKAHCISGQKDASLLKESCWRSAARIFHTPASVPELLSDHSLQNGTSAAPDTICRSSIDRTDFTPVIKPVPNALGFSSFPAPLHPISLPAIQNYLFCFSLSDIGTSFFM